MDFMIIIPSFRKEKMKKKEKLKKREVAGRKRLHE